MFPAHYPKELLWALDVVPVEIWDPKIEPKLSPTHLQSYICSVAGLGLELILQGKCDAVDGFLFPHTCDSLQNLASVVHDYIGLSKPCYFFYVPKAPYGEAARIYYRDRLKLLTAELETRFGRLVPAKLMQALERGRRVLALTTELYKKRAAGGLACSSMEFYRVLRAGEYLHPEDYIPLLEEFSRRAEGNNPKPSLVLSGVLPNPPELLEFIDELGLRVGNDDFYSCSRRLLGSSPGTGDPFDVLAERFFSLPPCTTRGAPIKDRADHLVNMVKTGQSVGVIFNIVKFCEAEMFDIPILTRLLKEEGIPALVVETELNSGLSGQIRTRVEAFAEMIGLEGP